MDKTKRITTLKELCNLCNDKDWYVDNLLYAQNAKSIKFINYDSYHPDDLTYKLNEFIDYVLDDESIGFDFEALDNELKKRQKAFFRGWDKK